MDSLITWLEGINASLPALPTGLREFLVKVAPYLAILGILLGIPAILAVLGFGSYFATYGGLAMSGFFSWYWIFLVIGIVLNILAVPGLFKRAKTGWTFMFYSVAVGAIGSLLMGNVVTALISIAIELYLLMQVRPYYIGMATVSQAPTLPNQQPPVSPTM